MVKIKLLKSQMEKISFASSEKDFKRKFCVKPSDIFNPLSYSYQAASSRWLNKGELEQGTGAQSRTKFWLKSFFYTWLEFSQELGFT